MPCSRGADPSKPLGLATAAVNLRADDGPVMAMELLHTPGADRVGIAENPKVLTQWIKK